MTADPATLQKDAERPNAERLAVLSALLDSVRDSMSEQSKDRPYVRSVFFLNYDDLALLAALLEAKIQEAENG